MGTYCDNTNSLVFASPFFPSEEKWKGRKDIERQEMTAKEKGNSEKIFCSFPVSGWSNKCDRAGRL